MAYCRWSSDDFQCDVYCYESDSGFQTHVATYRRTLSERPPSVSLPAGFTDEQFTAWLDRQAKVNALLAAAEHVKIGLPHDGESFEHEGPRECADNLERLREQGYMVPQYAIDALREEATAA